MWDLLKAILDLAVAILGLGVFVYAWVLYERRKYTKATFWMVVGLRLLLHAKS